MVLRGAEWFCVVLHVHVYVVLSGTVWYYVYTYVVLSGTVWYYVVLSGYVWYYTYVVLSGTEWCWVVRDKRNSLRMKVPFPVRLFPSILSTCR